VIIRNGNVGSEDGEIAHFRETIDRMAGDGIDSLDAKGAEQKEATELLCLLLNLPHNLGLQETVDLITNVVIFMRAHVALREDNEFMLLLCSSYGPVVLYHPSESEDVEVTELQSGSRNLSYARFEKAQDSIMAALKRLNDTVSSMSDFGNNSNEAKGGSGMANGVAKALCYVNKKRLMTVEAFNARILIVTAGAKQEDSKNYISLMNCIFSCQKMNVPLDVCIVETSQDDKGPSKRGSVFMEQVRFTVKSF
jgi:hypothetical protein